MFIQCQYTEEREPPVLQNVKYVVSLFSVTVTSEQLKNKAMNKNMVLRIKE